MLVLGYYEPIVLDERREAHPPAPPDARARDFLEAEKGEGSTCRQRQTSFTNASASRPTTTTTFQPPPRYHAPHTAHPKVAGSTLCAIFRAYSQTHNYTISDTFSKMLVGKKVGR